MSALHLLAEPLLSLTATAASRSGGVYEALALLYREHRLAYALVSLGVLVGGAALVGLAAEWLLARIGLGTEEIKHRE